MTRVLHLDFELLSGRHSPKYCYVYVNLLPQTFRTVLTHKHSGSSKNLIPLTKFQHPRIYKAEIHYCRPNTWSNLEPNNPILSITIPSSNILFNITLPSTVIFPPSARQRRLDTCQMSFSVTCSLHVIKIGSPSWAPWMPSGCKGKGYPRTGNEGS